MSQPHHHTSSSYKSKRRKRRNKRHNEPSQQKQSYHQQTHSSESHSKEQLLLIDGSMMEGGGQILRNSITFSALMKRAIHITNIRGKRSNPGLRKQHSKGIELVANINKGYLEGNYVKSMDIKYHPSDCAMYLNTYTVDIETAGSVCLLIQTALPLLVFSPYQCSLISIGGTNASFAPQIDYFILVLKPMLKRLMNIDIEIECTQRGFFPKGGGKVLLKTNPANDCIPCFDLTKRGKIKKIYGRIIIGGRGFSLSVGEDVIRGAVRELQLTFGKKMNIDIEIRPKHQIDSFSSGIGVCLVAETDTGCLFGGSSLSGANKGGKKGRYNKNAAAQMDYGEIGRIAARELVTDLKSTKGGCTDRWLQDQLVIFMALAKGKSKMATCALELHTQTAIHIAELFTGVKFNVSAMKDGTVLIECDGIGYDISKDYKHEHVEQKDNNEMITNEKGNDNAATNKEKNSYLNNRPSLF